MRWMERVRAIFERTLEWIAIFLMVALVVVVVVAVIYRKSGHSLSWYDEVASVMLAWLTYYGAALAALKRGHIGFAGLIEALPPPWRALLVAVSETFVIGFFAVLAWVGYDVVQVLEGDTLVSLPEVSTQLTQSVIPIGAVLFICAQLITLPEVWRRARGRAPR